MSEQAKIAWSDLTPEQQAEFGNGCGPAWMPNWSLNLVKNWLFGWCYESDCRRHDFAYSRGGSANDRKIADDGLYHAMLRDTARLKWWRYVLASIIAHCFYYLVRWFGWMRFYYGPYRSIDQLIPSAESING